MRDRHYPVRQFRISNENYKLMLKLKSDTWNKLFNQLLNSYGKPKRPAPKISNTKDSNL